MTNQFHDVVIVGAGMAGLYCGLRLKRSSSFEKSTVAIFEASERVGGRVRSQYYPALTLPCELGCMRYLKSQRLISNLIEKHYALQKKPFDTGNVNKHIYYLRGQFVDIQAWNVPYEISSEFQGMSPFKVLDKIIDQIKQLNNVEPHKVDAYEWAVIKSKMIYPYQGSMQGQYLQNIGFANLISQSSSYETLKFIADSGEYYSKTINWNASEAFPYSQTVGYKAKDDIEYWCVDQGFSKLAECMLSEFSQRGGEIYYHSELREISCVDGGYRLRFRESKNNADIVIYCKKVILAIPKIPLMKLNWQGALNDKFNSLELKNILNSIRPLPAIRFAMLFKKPWWHSDFNGFNGHMVTDLPIRHGYYFGSEDPNSYSVFLSTTDMHMTDYWVPFLDHDASHGVMPSHAVDEVLKQLKLVHRRDDIIAPDYAVFANWDNPLHGGGFHAWNPGYQIEKVMKAARKPFHDESIHIVGESFSGLQGWVEGALCTVEKLLSEHFQLNLNESWLERDYFYGY